VSAAPCNGAWAQTGDIDDPWFDAAMRQPASRAQKNRPQAKPEIGAQFSVSHFATKPIAEGPQEQKSSLLHFPTGRSALCPSIKHYNFYATAFPYRDFDTLRCRTLAVSMIKTPGRFSMIKQCGIIALACLLSVYPIPAEALSQDLALPRCKTAHETRTPVPIWKPDITQNGGLSAAPPHDRLVYIYFFADNDQVHCLNASDDKVYEFIYADRGTPTASAVKVHIRGKTQYTGWGFACHFSGFYWNDVTPEQGETIAADFRPTDKFDVMSSGHYCQTDPVPRRWPERRPHQATDSGNLQQYPGLPACGRDSKDRVPVSIWSPRVTPTPDSDAVSSEPPTGDGRLVYVSAVPSPRWCGRDEFSFILPHDPKSPDDGGVEINLRGNVHMENGRCTLAGFYMNEALFGILQGWVSTYFGAIDENQVIKSGAYCLAKPNAPARDARRSR
jgi:hypothetical protein